MLQYNGRIAKRNLFMISRSPVAARSKAWVCSRLFIGIKGSKLAGRHRCLSLVTVLFCVGLITRPEDTYRVLCALSFIVEPRRGNLGLIQQVCRAVRKKNASIIWPCSLNFWQSWILPFYLSEFLTHYLWVFININPVAMDVLLLSKQMKLTWKSLVCIIIRSFTTEGDGKSIMEEWNEKGSLWITDLVSVVGIPDCLSKQVAYAQERLTVNRSVKISDDITYIYQLS